MIDDHAFRTLGPEERDACWRIFTYELDMFMKLGEMLGPDAVFPREFMKYGTGVRNAVVESCVLHCRNICDILLSVGRGRDDIRLVDLLPDFHARALDDLRDAYGSRGVPGSCAHTLHYQCIHPWIGRGHEGNYGPVLCRLQPIMYAVLERIAATDGANIREALDRDHIKFIMGD